MDRIADIIRHEKAAERDDSAISAHRWAASKLMWEEHRAGSTHSSIAEAIGKSRQHVMYTIKCWEIIGRHYGSDNYTTFPAFGPVYNSPEVRGAAGKNRGPGRKFSPENADDRRPENAGQWVTTADASLDMLASNPASWDFLGDSDMTTLRAIAEKTKTIVAAVEARFASANPAA
jgi:hypothetical protein